MDAAAQLAAGRLPRSERERLHREIAALQRENAALAACAATDPLTGLANRRGLAIAWQHEQARCQRHGAPCSVLAADLDHFKQLNDARGHLAGDQVLRTVARVLVASVRAQDLVVRMGGDEFLVLLPEADLATATAIAERVQTALRQAALPSRPGGCTLSSGVACSPPTPYQELFAAADRALYRAKQQGRQRSARWDGDCDAEDGAGTLEEGVVKLRP